MTATISVLGRQGDLSPGDIARYFVPDYYTGEGNEKPGEWCGSAARELGLSGVVGVAPLTNVLSGRTPDGTRQLVQIQQQKGTGSKREKRRDRSPGYDLTFSLPKSISALYAVGGNQVRVAIDLAMDRASKKVIQYLETSLPLGRRGKGGCIQEPAKLLVGMFDHFVNRHLEPQRHRHCVIANVCQLEDGAWRSINSPLLHKWTRTLGPMFRSEFAHELSQAGLGLELYLPNVGPGKLKTAFEVRGVPEPLCKHWSSRKAEIDELLAGDEGGLAPTSAKARQEAALSTRESKQKTPPQAELQAKWREEAQEFGFDEQAVEGLCHSTMRIDYEEAYQTARAEALSNLLSQESDFSERQFIQKLFEALQHLGLPMDFVNQRITQDLAQGSEIVALNERDNEWRYTTKEMWDLEEAMLKDGERLQTGKGAQVPTAIIEEVLVKRPTISDEQAKAVRELLSDKSGLRVLTGVAGAGKSFTLDAVREGLEAAGYKVLGGALAGVATEELAAKANLPARTVASYLWHLGEKLDFLDHDKSDTQGHVAAHPQGSSRTSESPFILDNRTVLIIDEFGMLPTKAVAAIFRHATKAGATVLAVGDASQIQPVEAGAPLRHLMNARPHPTLQENLRQQGMDAQAVQDVRDGRAAKALENWRKQDRLVLGNNQTDTIRRLIKSWVKSGGRERPEEHLIFTQTRAEARAINRLCQQERHKAGLVDKSRQVTIGKQPFGKGDHVLFHHPIPEQAIRNGYSGVVLRVNPHAKTITIRLDVERPNRDSVVTIPLCQIKADGITGNHARTINKGQGQTVANSYVLLGGSMTSRETVYTQCTRGKLTTKVFVDRWQAGEDLRDLAKAMDKSKAKGLAHDLGLRLQIEREQKR